VEDEEDGVEGRRGVRRRFFKMGGAQREWSASVLGGGRVLSTRVVRPNWWARRWRSWAGVVRYGVFGCCRWEEDEDWEEEGWKENFSNWVERISWSWSSSRSGYG
jgi:hypothetical protein